MSIEQYTVRSTLAAMEQTAIIRVRPTKITAHCRHCRLSSAISSEHISTPSHFSLSGVTEAFSSLRCSAVCSTIVSVFSDSVSRTRILERKSPLRKSKITVKINNQWKKNDWFLVLLHMTLIHSARKKKLELQKRRLKSNIFQDRKFCQWNDILSLW